MAPPGTSRYAWTPPARYARNPALEVDDEAVSIWPGTAGTIRRIPISAWPFPGTLGKAGPCRTSIASGQDPWGEPLLAARPDGGMFLFNGRYGNEYQFLDVFTSLDQGNTWKKQEVAIGDDYPFQRYSLCVSDLRSKSILAGAGARLPAINTAIGIGSWPGTLRGLERHPGLEPICPWDEKTALSASGDGVDATMTGRRPVPAPFCGRGAHLACSGDRSRHRRLLHHALFPTWCAILRERPFWSLSGKPTAMELLGSVRGKLLLRRPLPDDVRMICPI